VHEPKPSRRFKFLSNLYLQGKIGNPLVCFIFKISRSRLFKKLNNQNYIESSNFIFGCIPALNNCRDNISVIHIVRNPKAYVYSHLNHGFWEGSKKFAAKYIPYWLEPCKLNDEQKKDPVSILLERWAYVNSQIERYASTNNYLMVRFEDIFTKDNDLSVKTLNRVRDFLNLPDMEDSENIKWLDIKLNESTKKQNKYTITEEHLELFSENHKDMLKNYNYSLSLNS
jgi:hypothetical protein